MAKGILKEKQKNRKMEMKQKKQNKKLLIISICVLITILALIFILYSVAGKTNNEIETYSNHGQTIQLLADGTFTARLAHNVRKNGTFTRTVENDRTIVSFNVNGNIEIGQIINNSLYIPREWDDGHGHGNVFSKVSK
ncbi:MAG: hypothetical protein LBU88_02880 [Treponema sp.]|jgi:hypothetical protein|nr:hypothetical protein [Treponema sp.]